MLTDEDRKAIKFARNRAGYPSLDAAAERCYIAGMETGKRAGIAEALAEAEKLLHMTRDQAQLLAGEMTAQEWRTVAAILANRIAAIRALAKP